MSILQIKYNDTKSLESEKCTNEEYTVASRKVCRLPHNFVQYWIDTGHLPHQFYVDTAVHSDTGSSLTEEESLHEQNAICNAVLKYKLNDKQLCNNGSSNSSVDTAAYVLSNTNITKKDNVYPKFFKKDGILKIHKVINYANKETDTAANIYNTIDSNISNLTSAFDIHNRNKMYQKGAELGEKNIIEGIEFKSSSKENTDEICQDDDQISEVDLNCQNEEYVENSIEKIRNMTNINKNNSFFDNLHNDSITQIRQKKLYIGRESPIDINMYVVSDSLDNNISEEKRNLHPAYRNSPLLQKPYRKFVPKKRKYKYILKNSRNTNQEDTSSNTSTIDNTDIETRNAKRLRSLEDLENDVAETQLFSTISQTSEKDKLRQSCEEMEKQIKRFSLSQSTNINKLKQLNHDHILQDNTTYNKKHLRRRNVLKSQKKIQRKITQKKTNVGSVLHDTLHKKPNPIVLLERLSEKVIKQYIHKTDLNSKATKKNSVSIKNMVKGTNKRNYRARSVMSKDTGPHLQIKNVDSESSSASTIIIYNHTDSQFISRHDSNDSTTIKLNSIPLPSSDNTEKNQLDKFSSDIKLIQMRPVVLVKRLHAIESSMKKHTCKLNNLKNKCQPIVVLERLSKINGNWSHNINLPICNELNKIEANKTKHRKANKKMNNINDDSKKLLCFKTKIYSDSDSDDSSTERSFNLNTSMKYNIKNKTTNHKSLNSLRISMLEDFESPVDRKTNISRIFTKKQEIDNKHKNMRNCNLHMPRNNGQSFLEKISCVDANDNPLDNLNKGGYNQMVHSLPTMKLTSDKSEKDKDIVENNVKNTVIIDSNMKNKKKKFVFVTKAYDSDSE